jgi:uncharacterized glyoxalase superfamily protein PhnB
MQSAATNFSNVSPLIPARDVEEGIAFYRNALGFELTYRDADPAQFAILGRKGVKLHLFDNQDKHLADRTSLRIVVERIDTLYGRCQENGCVHPNGLLGSRPWGTREFSIIDPSGVCIAFVEQATMENSQEKKESWSETKSGGLNSGLVPDPEVVRRFLEALSPAQVSKLIVSGALDDIIPNEEIDAPDLDPTYPHPTEREGFDFEKWKNQPDPKIR